MKPLEIKIFPDEILRMESVLVKEITRKEIKILKQMLNTMKHFKGLGLAAPQIGVSRRLIVAGVGEDIFQLANPEIIDRGGKDKMIEGCLSISQIMLEIERAYRVVVRGLNEKGDHIEIEAQGLLARVFQHEIDHLNGKLIIDYRKQNNLIEQEVI